MGRRGTTIERLLHAIEEHIEVWRAKMNAREGELQAHREMLWAEASEREKLLAQIAGERENRESRSLRSRSCSS